MKNPYKTTEFACAVLLITSSIAMAAYQVFDIDDVASGTLMYIAQAFLLAGSIFGLDAYVKAVKEKGTLHVADTNKPGNE